MYHIKHFKMKNLIFIGFTIVLTAIWSCEEHPPFTINMDNDSGEEDTTTTTEITPIYNDSTFIGTVVAAQEKVILLEDFTGVQCVNCPAGHEVVSELLSVHSGRIASVAVHAGFLSDPIPNYSTQNMVIPQGQALYDMLEVPAVPAAAIDRILFEGESYLAIVNANRWGGKVAEQLLKTTPVNLYIHKNYTAATRQLDVYLQVRYTETQTTENRLHLFLLEDNIIEAQENAENGTTEVIPDYNHQHVLRKVVTPVEGQAITAPDKQAGRVYVKKFSFQIPDNVNPDNASVLAFVQEKNGTSQAILQSGTLKVVE